MSRIEDIKEELKSHEDYELYLNEPHHCVECGKRINNQYLPSNFCKKCVDIYVDGLENNCKFGI